MELCSGGPLGPPSGGGGGGGNLGGGPEAFYKEFLTVREGNAITGVDHEVEGGENGEGFGGDDIGGRKETCTYGIVDADGDGRTFGGLTEYPQLEEEGAVTNTELAFKIIGMNQTHADLGPGQKTQGGEENLLADALFATSLQVGNSGRNLLPAGGKLAVGLEVGGRGDRDAGLAIEAMPNWSLGCQGGYPISTKDQG